jgi:hypothetical protein
MSKMNVLKIALEQLIDDIDCGNSNASDEDVVEILEMINSVSNTRNKLSKYQAMKMLNVSRSTFDKYVSDGLLPEGKKQQGFKEKF